MVSKDLEGAIVIVGPTASGKTELAHQIARSLPVGILAADSRTVYKHLDVGTAKPTWEERSQVPYYGLDLVPPDAPFSVFDFKRIGQESISRIRSQNRIPLIVGGTGLYVRALLDDLSLAEIPPHPELRARLYSEAEKYGSAYLHTKLKRVDPYSAYKIHPNDTKRIVRALEIFLVAGKPKSFFQDRRKEGRKRVFVCGITLPRQLLYQRIEARVEVMYQKGLLKEAAFLLEKGFANTKAAEGIGYREAISYLKGEISLEEAKAQTKKRTRHYAKRQLTWFRKEKDIYWLDGSSKNVFALAEELLKAYHTFSLFQKQKVVSPL